MPRVITLIKNCCYFTLVVALVTVVSSLFVWQADVYQSTIDEQVRLMKLDIAAMKKENHLMEIKLNEQYGKHDDLKEEFRYILKQAKWQVSDQGKDKDTDSAEVKEKTKRDEVPHYVLNIGNKPETKEEEDQKPLAPPAAGNDALVNALRDVGVGEEGEEQGADMTDLSKRTNVLIVSEKKGGSDILGHLVSHDENIFYLPAISSVIRTEDDFSKIRHCVISDEVVTFYKTHQTILMGSRSLSKFCPEGKCEGFTAGALENECVKKHVTVMDGAAEDWSLKTLDRLSVEIAYVSRDPRAVVSELMDIGDVTEESVQEFSKQMCARMAAFIQYQPSSHYVYQVVKYEKLATSPLTTLSEVYHKLLSTTSIPSIPLSKEYKNELYLSVSEWKHKLPQISADAVNEECPSGVS